MCSCGGAKQAHTRLSAQALSLQRAQAHAAAWRIRHLHGRKAVREAAGAGREALRSASGEGVDNKAVALHVRRPVPEVPHLDADRATVADQRNVGRQRDGKGVGAAGIRRGLSDVLGQPHRPEHHQGSGIAWASSINAPLCVQTGLDIVVQRRNVHAHLLKRRSKRPQLDNEKAAETSICGEKHVPGLLRWSHQPNREATLLKRQHQESQWMGW
eukprot:1127807-Rhodomonas_salina.3